MLTKKKAEPVATEPQVTRSTPEEVDAAIDESLRRPSLSLAQALVEAKRLQEEYRPPMVGGLGK